MDGNVWSKVHVWRQVYIWFKLEWSKHAKKGQQEKIFVCTLNKGQLSTLLILKSFTFYIPFENLHVFKGIRNETYTFQFKKA